MTSRNCFSWRSLCTAVLACLLLQGCHQIHRLRQPRHCAIEPVVIPLMPMPYGAPVVCVIGDQAPDGYETELQVLATEISNGLITIGGIRMVDAPQKVPMSNCAGPSEGVIPLLACSDHHTGLVGTDRPDQIEVVVVIDEFSPYRPIQLGATITVRHSVTGAEISAIQGHWYGAEPDQPVADADHSLRRALKHPHSRAVGEAENLTGLSPQLFLKSVAMELAPAIHAMCQTNGSPAIGSGWSVPAEVHLTR